MKMSDWDSNFEIWENYSPFLRRNLITREEFYEWAKQLEYTLVSSKEETMFVFLDYIEELDLLHPVYISKHDSEFGKQQRELTGIFYIGSPSEEEKNKIVKYYHPFQFFQFIIYWICYKEKSGEESRFNYYLSRKKIESRNSYYEFYLRDKKGATPKEIGKKKRKIIDKINKEEEKWIKKSINRRFRSYNKNIRFFSEGTTYRERRRKLKKNRKDLKVAIKKKKVWDNTYIKIIHSHWLNPDFLKVWIKLDSLHLFPEYIITPSMIDVDPVLISNSKYDETERDLTRQRYYEWREGRMKSEITFLNEEEREILKDFYSRMYNYFTQFHSNKLYGLQNWEDLLDMIPNEKLSKLTGDLNLSINILLILRYLTRVSWELFNYNLLPWLPEKENKKPYFYFKDEEEVINFRKSVIADFNLFVSTPFILYVEGQTEKEILDYYFKKKGIWFPITVENIKGIDKVIQTLTINKPLQDRYYYYFLDYENEGKYKKNKKLIKHNGNFFFPDFVTENFKPITILNLFNTWIEDLGGNLTDEEREYINQILHKCKIESNNLLRMSEKKGGVKGYETELINYSRKRLTQVFMDNYPDIITGEEYPHIDPEKFERKFKKVFTENYLISIINDSLENNLKREKGKFPFEEKLAPFYNGINNYIYRNQFMKYDHKIPENIR